MYKIISCISTLIRLFFLPNPFDSLPQYPIISIFGASITLAPELLNWFAEPILHAVTFAIVGLFYTRKSDDPAVGSLLYLVFYIIHVFLLMVLSAFDFSILAVILIIGGYVGVLFLAGRFFSNW